jgi:hypothetical protein
MSSLQLRFERRRQERNFFTLPENWDRTLSFFCTGSGQCAAWLKMTGHVVFLVNCLGQVKRATRLAPPDQPCDGKFTSDYARRHGRYDHHH